MRTIELTQGQTAKVSIPLGVYMCKELAAFVRSEAEIKYWGKA